MFTVVDQNPPCGAAKVGHCGVHVLTDGIVAVDPVQGAERGPESTDHGRTVDRATAHQPFEIMASDPQQFYLLHVAGADVGEIRRRGKEPGDRIGHHTAHGTGHNDHQISAADHVV